VRLSHNKILLITFLLTYLLTYLLTRGLNGFSFETRVWTGQTNKQTDSTDSTNDVIQQSFLNATKISGRKTKEMLLGPIRKDMSPPLILDGAIPLKELRVLSYLAFTYPMISSGHNTSIPSRPKQHPESRLIFLNNSDALVHHTKTMLCFYSVAYSSAPGTRICSSSLALKPYICADWGAWDIAEVSRENH